MPAHEITTPAPATGPARTPDFGSSLRQAREKRGVSLRQISTNTKIAMITLEALERNDAGRLPGGIFSRSFVRAYAREVGLDPEQAVRDFVAAFPEQGGESEPPRTGSEPDADLYGESPRWYRSVLRAAGVVVPLALVIAYFTVGQRLWPGGTSTGEPPLPAPVAAPSTVASQPQSPTAAPAGPEAGTAEPAGTPAGTPPAIALSQSLPAIDTGVVDSESRVVLRLAPASVCWIQVAVDGGPPEQQLMQAGDTREIRAKDELVLTVGDAGVLAYSINGLPGRPLGGPGAVVKAVRITAGNFRTFVAQRP